jgi:hypothetical protein
VPFPEFVKTTSNFVLAALRGFNVRETVRLTSSLAAALLEAVLTNSAALRGKRRVSARDRE